jgi:hypothetical protein
VALRPPGCWTRWEILRVLNDTGARRVPDDAPDGFVPAWWRGYLETAAKSGNTSAYRHYWELCTLLALRDRLRTGDVYVPGSRRYSDPAAYLLTPDKWVLQRAEFCQLVGKPADPARALADAWWPVLLERKSSTVSSSIRPLR